MYVRNTSIIILSPGKRGSEHASERFSTGGTCETDLLPQGDEIDLYRIVVPHHLPDTIMQGIAGRSVRDVIAAPPFRGACPVRGCDLGGDTLNRIQDNVIVRARTVERGTLIAIAP